MTPMALLTIPTIQMRIQIPMMNLLTPTLTKTQETAYKLKQVG
jgi:hypothetical protein